MLKVILIFILKLIGLYDVVYSESNVTNIVLDRLEETYNEDFQVVRYSYNKSTGNHEFYMMADCLEDNVPFIVKYDIMSDDLYDNFYSTKYGAEIKETYLSDILSQDNYIACYSGLRLYPSLTGTYSSYEDYVDSLNNYNHFEIEIYVDSPISDISSIEESIKSTYNSINAIGRVIIFDIYDYSVSECKENLLKGESFYSGIADFETYLDLYID